jgi:hypothetical protein
VKQTARLGGGLVVEFGQYQPTQPIVIELINYTDATGDFEVTRTEGIEKECLQTQFQRQNQRYSLLLSVSTDDACASDSDNDSVDWGIIVGVVVGVVVLSVVIGGGLFYYKKIRTI